jgi:hypothetical protein
VRTSYCDEQFVRDLFSFGPDKSSSMKKHKQERMTRRPTMVPESQLAFPAAADTQDAKAMPRRNGCREPVRP